MAEEKMRFYRLKFFSDLRGRGEAIRLMFYLSDTQYERVDYTWEEWEKIKPTMPLRQLPVLETEDGYIAQTLAISNFLANRLGFQPESEWDRAVSESLVVSLIDVIEKVGYTVYIYTKYKFKECPGEDQLVENKKTSLDLAYRTLKYLECQAKPGAKYIMGDKITLVDLMLHTALEYCSLEFPELKTCSDWMKKWVENFEAEPKIAEYLENKTPTRWGT